MWQSITGTIIIVAIVVGLGTYFLTRPAVTPTTTVGFEISNLIVSPAEVEPGEEVTISVDVQNLGEVEDTDTIRLIIGGTVEATQGVTLAGGGSTTISFDVTKEEKGIYTLVVEGQSGVFKVELLKVALLLPGSISDYSWNRQGYESLLEAEEELGVEVAFKESVYPPDVEPTLGAFAEEGYDLIISHSPMFSDGTLNVAGDYPNTFFIVASGSVPMLPNMAFYTGKTYEVYYLAGILAGMMTETNVIGTIMSYDFAPLRSMNEAFKLGIHSVNPEAEVLETIAFEWSDVSKGRGAALSQIEIGADFIVPYGDGLTRGAIMAANEEGVYAIGYNADMNSIAPYAVITSAVWDPSPIWEYYVNQIRTGTFENEQTYFGFPENSIYLSPFHVLEAEVPQEVKDKIAEVEEKISSGEIEVPYIPVKPE